MAERICGKTIWHEMEGPYIGGREHYQEKSYGFEPKWEPCTKADEGGDAEKDEGEEVKEDA